MLSLLTRFLLKWSCELDNANLYHLLKQMICFNPTMLSSVALCYFSLYKRWKVDMPKVNWLIQKSHLYGNSLGVQKLSLCVQSVHYIRCAKSFPMKSMDESSRRRRGGVMQNKANSRLLIYAWCCAVMRLTPQLVPL